jgi:hypothetical protein
MQPEKITIDVTGLEPIICDKIEALIYCILGDRALGQVILTYGSSRKMSLVPMSVLEEVCLVARDVVRTHTRGWDGVQDKFMERLANLIQEGNHGRMGKM